MSGDHNEHQKDKSYLDFECPRCGHCCHVEEERMSTQPKALRLADALDAEFVQGRISNSTGRESAVELRRLALKQWVGLTDDEIMEPWPFENRISFARWVESKVREKNT